MLSNLKTLIVDDKPDNINLLSLLLSKHKDIFSTPSTADSYKKALDILKVDSFNVTFLDTYLDSGKTCYSLLSELHRPDFGVVIFNSEVARSIEYKNQLPLLSGMRFTYLESLTEAAIADVILELKKLIGESTILTKYITVFERATGIMRSVNQSDIYYIEADGNYSIFFVWDSFTQTLTRRSYQDGLNVHLPHFDKSMFVQTHKSYIVNLSKVVGLKPDRTGGLLIFDAQIPDSSVRYSKSYKESIIAFARRHHNKDWSMM